MIVVLFLLSVDPSLGKVDKLSLSQQTLMELFVEGITNKENIFKDSENPTDVTDWKLLTFNDASEVIDILWSYNGLKGTVSLQWLPQSVKKVFLYSNFLGGTIDLTCLPTFLEKLDVSDNALEGTVDVTALPETLTGLNLSSNAFHGKTDLSRLPKSLDFLGVSNTQLEGEVFDFDGHVGTFNSNVKHLRSD